jgi:hypothetical protein
MVQWFTTHGCPLRHPSSIETDAGCYHDCYQPATLVHAAPDGLEGDVIAANAHGSMSAGRVVRRYRIHIPSWLLSGSPGVAQPICAPTSEAGCVA